MTQLSKFWLLKIKSIVLCHVWLFATPWTVARQAPSEFSREEYWSGLPFLSPGDLPNPGIEPSSPALQVDSLPSNPPGKPKNTRIGIVALLQEIFPNQESDQGLLFAGRFFTSWATREALTPHNNTDTLHLIYISMTSKTVGSCF